MKDRIKRVRNEARMSQAAFAERIGISAKGVQKLEYGENVPSEQTIRAICREFHVNREWLETGEGSSPYIKMALDDELADLMAGLLKDKPEFKHRLIAVLLRMNHEEWAMLEQKAMELLEEIKKDAP